MQYRSNSHDRGTEQNSLLTSELLTYGKCKNRTKKASYVVYTGDDRKEIGLGRAIEVEDVEIVLRDVDAAEDALIVSEESLATVSVVEKSVFAR